MWEFDESAAQFPAPSGEEPADLRRDIIAELADHLTCARRREQLADGPQSEEAVRGRVLDRFGDPAAVARKLWLDWMWEKIMAQRILVGVCVVMAVVSCVALALAWTSLSRQQEMMAAWQSTSETQLREQQKLFERLLAQSEKATAAASVKSEAPSDWNPVELRFVSGTEDGPPAAGIKVRVEIKASESGIPPMEGVSSAQGVVRFERVRYGAYTVRVWNAADETISMGITLQPGEGLTRTIICPDPPARSAEVYARIEWPDDLADKPLWFRFEKGFIYRLVAGMQWHSPTPLFERSDGSRPPRSEALVAPNGVAVPVHHQYFSDVNRRRRGDSQRTALSRRYSYLPFVAEEEPAPMPQPLRWPGNQYVILSLQVLLPESGIRSPEELPSTASRSRPPDDRSRLFHLFGLSSADWSYRIEPGTEGKPGTLWLTPTAEAVEKVRAALAEMELAKETETKKEEADGSKRESDGERDSSVNR